MPRSSRRITVTLGALQKRVDARVKAGTYASASEVLQDIQKAFDDPRPSIPASTVSERLRQRSARRRAKAGG